MAAAMLRLLGTAACVISTIAQPAVAQPDYPDPDSLQGVRAEFIEARMNAANGIDMTADGDSERLRRYLLYPYLTAARLERRLLDAAEVSDSLDTDIREFVDIHAGQPVSFTLYRSWMSSTAERHAWRTFIDNYDRSVATTAHECQYLIARIALDDTPGLSEAISELWLSPRQLPIECEPAFEWLRGVGVLDDALTERRVRMLLEVGEVGFARIIARRLPERRGEPLLRWARLLQNPISEFDALIAAPRAGVLVEAVDSAWPRFASANPEAALARLDLLIETQRIDESRTSRYSRDLALGLAWDRRARDAISLFSSVSPEHLDDYALEWLTRAALWIGDWRLVQSSIRRMSLPLQQESAWRYWQARSSLSLGDRTTADQLLRTVVEDDNYYSAMAAAHLGTEAQPHVTTLPRDPGLIQTIVEDPVFLRARELFAIGMRTEATREWRYALASLSAAERTQAIHVAASWQWFDVGIASATAQGVFNDYELLYPLLYSGEVSSAADLSRLPSSLILGLIRQESLFREDAVSAAGAIGLTQLIPDTARRTARAWSLAVPSTADLFVPTTNIMLGAATLKGLADRFDGQIPVALAAYNAGPNAAERWLPERPIDADIWTENIPYNETRAFVRRVLWHSVIFAWREAGNPQRTTDWIDLIRRPEAN